MRSQTADTHLSFNNISHESKRIQKKKRMKNIDKGDDDPTEKAKIQKEKNIDEGDESSLMIIHLRKAAWIPESRQSLEIT